MGASESMITQEALLTTGKAKAVFATSDPNILWLHSLDQATALNGKQKEHIPDKGRLTTQISGVLFDYLNQAGIKTHYLSAVDATDILVTKLTMLPVEVVVRNYAAGHFASRFDVEPMTPLVPVVEEYYYKRDDLDDPALNASQAVALKLATPAQLASITEITARVNQLLAEKFKAIGITLVDFKIEFGLDAQGQLVLGDELSPDNMRLIDDATGKSLDKDVFRRGEGDLRAGYEIVLHRLNETTTKGE
jgi:phosphoribosylaminoimidazole-succinocarboxamide synthase